MGRFDKVCTLCGNEYEFCSHCSRFDNLPRFMSSFCSSNCNDLFNLCCDFEQGVINKEEAKEKLEKLDLSRRMYYKGSIANSVNKILGDDSKEETEIAVEAKEENNDEAVEQPVVEEVEIPVEDTAEKVSNNVSHVFNNNKRHKKNR